MKTSILATLFLAYGLEAAAVPTLYPDRFNYGLKNNTNSDILADSENSGRYYVLPPNSSAARITGLNTMTANTGFCRELANIQSYASETIAQVNQVKNREVDLALKYADEEAKVGEARKNLESYVQRNDLQNLDRYRMLIEEKNRQVDDVTKKLSGCRFFCSDLHAQLSAFQKELQNLYDARREASQQGDAEKLRVYSGLSQNLATAAGRAEESLVQLRELRHELMELYKDYIELFDAHSQREGGRVTMAYDSGWTQNINQLSRDNPRFSFEKAPTQNARIRADAYDKKNLLPHGSVLSFEVAGQTVLGGTDIGGYPETFSGSATLNLLAVCPMLHPEWFDLSLNRDWTKPENIKFGLTVAYDYPSQFKFDLKAKFNLYKMYEVVKSEGTEGGFLTTKSWSTLEEQNEYRDAFEAVWSSQSSELDLTPQQKFEIESDLKKQMLNRLASQIVMNSSTNKLLPAPTLPKAGALVLSQSLKDNCGISVLCRLGGAAVDLIYSVFSRTEVTETLRQQINADQEEHYTNGQVLARTNVTTYW